MRVGWRSKLESWLGQRGFLFLYSCFSLAVIAWLASAFVRAPFIPLWPWSSFGAWIPVIIMPLVTLLLVAGLSSVNPFSLSLISGDYDHHRPGIVSITRHPVMWAVVIWAGAHIPANGDAAGLILFILMLILSLVGTLTLEKGRESRYPKEDWQQWRANTSNLPFGAMIQKKMAIDWRGIGAWRVLAATLLYVVLLLTHQWFIGVPTPLAVLLIY